MMVHTLCPYVKGYRGAMPDAIGLARGGASDAAGEADGGEQED